MLRWFEQREDESCDACTGSMGGLRLTGMIVKESTKKMLRFVWNYMDMEIIHLA